MNWHAFQVKIMLLTLEGIIWPRMMETCRDHVTYDYERQIAQVMNLFSEAIRSDIELLIKMFSRTALMKIIQEVL